MNSLLSYDSNKTTFIYCRSPYSQSHSYSFQNADHHKKRGRRFKMNSINNCQHKSSSETVSFFCRPKPTNTMTQDFKLMTLSKNQENVNTC